MNLSWQHHDPERGWVACVELTSGRECLSAEGPAGWGHKYWCGDCGAWLWPAQLHAAAKAETHADALGCSQHAYAEPIIASAREVVRFFHDARQAALAGTEQPTFFSRHNCLIQLARLLGEDV